MTTPGEKLSLETFLAETGPAAQARIRDGMARIERVARHLLDHASTEPEIRAQLEQLLAPLKPGLAETDRQTRTAAAHEIETLRADLKQRWIDADAPPLVDEIDTHLAEITAGIEALRGPDPSELRTIAGRIDALSRRADAHGGLEARYLPWAKVAAAIFVLGLALLIFPRSFPGVPLLSSNWLVILCLGAFPAVAIAYARAALPRSRLDAEIESLNQQYFVPFGGIYFSADTGPPSIIRVPIPDPDPDQGVPRDPRKDRHRISPW